jgi:hypothetical protein
VDGGGLRFSGLVRYELATTTGGATGVDLAQSRHQVGLGVRATILPPPRPQVAGAASATPAPVVGRVRWAWCAWPAGSGAAARPTW